MKAFHIIALIGFTLCAACGEKASEAPAPHGAMHNVHILGRTVTTEDGLEIGWPASGVEMRAEAGLVTATIDDDHGNWMDLSVDGEARQLHLEPGRHDYVLYEGEKGVHDIRLTRLSEVFDFGLTTIAGVETDGAFLPVPEKKRKMLFLGDSITVGYGALGPDRTCSYTPDSASPWKSYASLTADAFDAERRLVAISGRGVVRNYDDPDPKHFMSYLFDMALPDTEIPWDHAAFVPDVMVIHLGTNDFSHGDPGPSFDARYQGLLEHARAVYPNALIVTAIGPIEPGDERPNAASSIKEVVAERHAAGDDAVTFIQLPLAAGGSVFGCDSHPGIDGHEAMAAALTAKIAALTGWTSQP